MKWGDEKEIGEKSELKTLFKSVAIESKPLAEEAKPCDGARPKTTYTEVDHFFFSFSKFWLILPSALASET